MCDIKEALYYKLSKNPDTQEDLRSLGLRGGGNESRASSVMGSQLALGLVKGGRFLAKYKRGRAHANGLH